MFGWLGIVLGILLILIGGFMVFFLPTTEKHQPESMAWTGVIVGIVFLIIGGILLFVW